MIRNISHGIELPKSVTEEITDSTDSVDIPRESSEADHPTKGGVEPAIPL